MIRAASVREVPGGMVPVVELHGDIDLATGDGGGDVLVDLAGVTLIDGASLGVLVRAGRAAERRGRTLHLVAPSAFVQRILMAAGLGDVFSVVHEERRAMPSAA
jgi:anti-anti-sigma regulatory factor